MNQLFQAGEQQRGRYRVRFTRFSRGGWHTYGPWMRVLVTDQRLIILPDEVRQQEQAPLVIAAGDIAHVWSVGLRKRDGGVLELKNGTLLYFYVDWSQSGRLIQDIRAMIRPAVAAAGQAAATGKRYTR